MVATMSDEDIPMAQCGACDSIIPLDSESCPECNVRFGGMSDQELGECGACQAIIPVDSTSCSNCGAVFVEEETVVEEAAVVAPQITESSDENTDVDETQETSVSLDDAEEPEDSEDADEIEELLDVPVAQIEDTHEESDESEENQLESESSKDDEPVELPVSIDEYEEDDTNTTDEDTLTETETVDESYEDELESEEETVAEEENIEAMMDDLVDDLEDEESEDDVEEDEKEPESAIEESEIVMAFENLALAIAAKGMTAAEAFGEMDSSDDHLIDAPELQKGIENIAGEKLDPKQVTAILNYLDTDGDKRVDPNELVKALEDLRIGIQPGKLPKVKSFPSPLQKFLMGKKANDIVYPIAYFLMVTFIGLWVVNGMGLLVDGTGGTVVYEGGTDQWGGEITQANWNLCQSDAFDEMIDPCQGTVSVGETYPCDPALDPNKCQNSLTPFSGTKGASSMPAAFYGDGVFMIILGVIGLAATAYLHLMYAPSLRDRAKKGNMKEEEAEDDDKDDSSADESIDDESEEEEDDEDGEDALEAPVDLEIADESDDEDDDEEEYDDDDIDVGDWIGLEVDGEEFFGEIVEFDDDEGTVTIETEDGEEITGDQEDMFLDDE